MASTTKENGFWRKKENQKRAVFDLLKKHNLLDPIDAGQLLTLKMIEDSPCTNIRAYAPTKYELLQIHFGTQIKPWMVRKHGERYKFTRKDVIQCLDYVSEKTGKPPETLFQKDLMSNGFYNLLHSFNYDFRKILEIYSGTKKKPWEYRSVPPGYWANKENVSYAVKWLVEEKLKIPIKRVPELITSDHFDRHGLSTVITYMSIEKAVQIAYPSQKFETKSFRHATTLALLGYAFEDTVNLLLRDGLKLKYLRGQAIPQCTHSVKCKPDIIGLNIPSICKAKNILDIKLFAHSYFASKTSRYLDHTDKLKIIFLSGSIPTNAVPNVEFINVDLIVERIQDKKFRNMIIKELKILREGRFPPRLKQLEITAKTQKINMKCVLVKHGNCTINQRSGEIGIVHSRGFCVWHWRLFREGKVSLDGKLLENVEKRFQLSDNQKTFLEKNYQKLSNKELAKEIYGKTGKSFEKRVSLHLRKLGLKRTKNEIAKIKGQILTYNETTLNMLRKNCSLELPELCKLLRIENTSRNRGRIHEAMIRYGIIEQREPYTKKSLIKIFKDYIRKTGTIPTMRELDKIPELPGKGTYSRFFGSWDNFLKAASIVNGAR